MEIEIIRSKHRDPRDKGEGEVVIIGVGVFKVGDHVTGNAADLQPLVAAGHAKLVKEPGAAPVTKPTKPAKG